MGTIAVLIMAAGTTVRADGEKATLREVLGLLSPESPAVVSAHAAAIRAEAAVAPAGVLANPLLSFTREDLLAAGAPGDQNLLSLGLPVEIAGEPGLRRAVAAAHAAAAGEDLQWETLRARARIRILYHLWRAAFDRASLERAFLEALGRAESAVRARVEAGDASAYDLMRLRVERSRHEAMMASHRAETSGRRGELEIALGRDLPSGAAPFDPLPAPELPPTLDGMRPDLRAALHRERAAAHALTLASRSWVPTFTFTLGLDHVHGMGVEYFGYAVGVAFDLPILDTGRRHRLGAEKMLTASRTERASLETAVAAETGAARTTYSARRAVLLELRKTLDETRMLPEVAEAAYSAGELDVVGLIDAHRALLETLLQEIDLALNAAHAWDVLLLVTGEEDLR